MSDIKISVVMPVLNGMPYFKKALESVVCQTLKEIQILVVDAGSTDGTAELVEEYAKNDDRIRLVKVDKKSMGYQYNKGISIAKGKYIGFCESDDYMSNDMMYELYKCAEKFEFPDIVKSDFNMFMENSEETLRIKKTIIPPENKDLYGKVIKLTDCVGIIARDANMWNGIYRRDFIEKNEVLLNETPGAAFQDTDFIQQVLLQSDTLIYLPNTYYEYRRDNPQSSAYKAGVGKFSLQELEYMVDLILEKKNIHTEFIQRVINRLFGLFVYNYSKDRYYDKSLFYETEVENYAKKLKKQLEKSPLIGRMVTLRNTSLRNFIQDIDFFRLSVDRVKREEHLRMTDFLEYIKKQDELVIFGCGEFGQAMGIFLKNHRYEGGIVYCDNNKDMQGKKVLGFHVKSVDEAVKNHGKSLFIVFNSQYCFEMVDQLLECKLEEERIYIVPPISVHDSMEINNI